MSHAITLTPSAVKHFNSILTGDQNLIRLQVNPAGCSGLGYEIKPVDEAKITDKMFKTDNLTLLVDEQSFEHLKGTEIDYVQSSDLNSQIKFNNPNVKHTCGCGESFGTN